MTWTVACGRPRAEPAGPLVEREAVHPTVQLQAERASGLAVGVSAESPQPAAVACTTCHGGPPPTLAQRNSGSKVHGATDARHGSMTCAACHDRVDRNSLRLADGTLLPLSDSMRLCAQCHGPQKRDYDHGAHGGMRGYWDLSQGPRQRNHCLSCHDPHAPAYPQVHPARAPTDLPEEGHP